MCDAAGRVRYRKSLAISKGVHGLRGHEARNAVGPQIFEPRRDDGNNEKALSLSLFPSFRRGSLFCNGERRPKNFVAKRVVLSDNALANYRCLVFSIFDNSDFLKHVFEYRMLNAKTQWVLRAMFGDGGLPIGADERSALQNRRVLHPECGAPRECVQKSNARHYITSLFGDCFAS